MKDRKDVVSCGLSGPEARTGHLGPLFLPGWTAGAGGQELSRRGLPRAQVHGRRRGDCSADKHRRFGPRSRCRAKRRVRAAANHVRKVLSTELGRSR